MTEQDIFEVRQTDVEIQEIFDQVPKNTKAIEDINGKLPAEASPENPLTDKEYVDGKIAAEKTRAEGAEQTLQQGINAEAQTRQQADQTLNGKIADNTQAIAVEQTRAEGVEQTLDGKIAAEKTRAEGAEGSLQAAIGSEAQTRQQADQTLDGKIGANTQAISTEKTRAEGAEQALQTAIDIINGKIPAQATAQNQLADKNFVNSSISTATADFKGTYNSLQELEQVTANANDYAFVIATDAEGNTVYKRYKWVDGNGWTWEYDLNNSSFTAAQWAAIQSGITAALVTKLSDLPTNAELNQRISTAITTALTSYYTKTEIDTALQAINTAIGQKADQSDLTAEVTRAQGAEQTNADAIAQLQAIIADIETVAEGYVRVAGSSSPALSYKSYKYHEQGGFGRESVFSLFYPCLVGTPLTGSGTEGKVLHVLQKFGARTIDGSPKWIDIYGTPHAIDGSEGDVMIVNIEPYYRINGKHTIEGTEYDVFLVSRTPFTWQGIEAEHVMKGGVSPDFCVSHEDTDGVVRMHSVYNPDWNGSYDAPDTVDGKYIYDYDAETGEITETYDENATLLGGAGGLHSTDIDLPTGEQSAMNMNPDTTKTVPWMNQTAASVEDWYSVLLAEGGTFDAHNANKMGSGYSANDLTAAGDWEQSASGAKNGLRLVDKDGDWRVYNFNSNMRNILGKGSTFYGGQIINSYRNPFHVLEAQRAVSFAIQNDVHELEWFAFEGNLYKYRSVEGFAGPEHGEMTCVLWKKLAGKLGAAAKDPSDTSVSIAGNRIEFLISIALFHGITTQVSPSWWTSGLLFTEDENGQYECYIERDQAELVKSLAAENYDPSTPRDFETIYDHVLTVQKGDGYAKNYLNSALMLPDSNANKSGAGLHTYVGKYNWFTGNNASAGKRSVRGFRRGTYARIASLSPLALSATYSPSGALTSIGFGTCCRITE